MTRYIQSKLNSEHHRKTVAIKNAARWVKQNFVKHTLRGRSAHWTPRHGRKNEKYSLREMANRINSNWISLTFSDAKKILLS